MPITSVLVAFLWLALALLLSAYVLLTEFAHKYNVPCWDTKWVSKMMDFLMQHAWTIGFCCLLAAIALGIFLVCAHTFYYSRWVYRRIRGIQAPLTDRQLLLMTVERIDRLVSVVEKLVGDNHDDKPKQQNARL